MLIQVLASVSETLDYIHQHNVFHRDLKPANIIIGLDGSPRIIDFGLCVHEKDQSRYQGEVAGTTAYMSPEQIRGESHHLDGRADIWAVGVMLYEGLVGRRPFQGNTSMRLADEILSRSARPLRQIDGSIPLELERICLRALEKNPSKRYLVASDLSQDLFRASGALNTKKQTPSAGAAATRLALQSRIYRCLLYTSPSPRD